MKYRLRGLDEAPHAYKDIDEVMKCHKKLLDIIGKFVPKIVKMDGAEHKRWGKNWAGMSQTDGE